MIFNASSKDTLRTLAAITGDEHYLQIYENHKGGMNMTEVAQALYQMGRDDSRKDIAKKMPCRSWLLHVKVLYPILTLKPKQKR